MGRDRDPRGCDSFLRPPEPPTTTRRALLRDGALGFWAALREVFGATCEQRCWFHKTGNILNRMPKSLHAKAKSDIHEIWMAATREDACKAFDVFLEK